MFPQLWQRVALQIIPLSGNAQVIIYSRRWEREWLLSYSCGFIVEYIRSSSLHTREKWSFCYIKGTGRCHCFNIRLYSLKVKIHSSLKTSSNSSRQISMLKSGFSYTRRWEREAVKYWSKDSRYMSKSSRCNVEP